MAAAKHVSTVESIRLASFLNEAVEKLQFLGAVTLHTAGSGEEVNQLGDEISRIIEEQRRLEARYEDLIAQRSQLKGLSNKSKWKDIQDEISRVAQELRQSTKVLCRNLKDNPNVGENLQKVQDERMKLEDVFTQCTNELHDLTFTSLKNAVQEYHNREESLNELMQKEREAQQVLARLREDLVTEKNEHERDLAQKADTISKLKEELTEIKARTQIEQKFVRKDTKSRADCNQRLHQQRDHELRENKYKTSKQLKIERRVHRETEGFLRRRIEALEKDIQFWMNKWETEVEAMDNQIVTLKNQREHDLVRLNELHTRYKEERRQFNARQEADRRLVEEKVIQEQMLAKVNIAATKIQALWRASKVRAALRKKKKKRKGKKKGKGKGKGKGRR
eukprot:TRINITY_DN3098_c0_g6_i1.p1 TRINITY_DN3098_c0_g6~~TRINITY_DN3098_c0_g6_i1.p1  ORF type:complete len:393 (+),score=106.48 TRINITY_DN3098_c0_g6_i1:359-1537(+)